MNKVKLFSVSCTTASFLLLVLISNPQVLAQSSVTLGYSILASEPKGGFEYSTPYNTQNSYFSIGFDQRDSSLVGYSIQFRTGMKSPTYGYPFIQYFNYLDDQYICYLYPNLVYQGVVFRYYEAFAGATLYGGRIIQVRLGPYISYNSPKTLDREPNTDSNYYFPASAKDMYTRIEFGGQLQLSLHLPIGKHFFLAGDGTIGTSFNDLRKDQWKDAFQQVPSVPEGEPQYVNMNSEKVSNRFYSYGLGIGFTW